MAKKVGLPVSVPNPPVALPEGKPAEYDGVRWTGGSGLAPDVSLAEELYPATGRLGLKTQDANDGTENGDQPSFEMPPFANGQDVRNGR